MGLYTIITLNGRGFTFFADDMREFNGTYTFYLEEDVVGEIKKDSIVGYFITRCEEGEESEEDEEDEDA